MPSLSSLEDYDVSLCGLRIKCSTVLCINILRVLLYWEIFSTLRKVVNEQISNADTGVGPRPTNADSKGVD